MSLNRITLFVAILGMICFSSCDGDDPNSGGIDTKDSKELVLKVIVPGINSSVTRGINATDENELGKIDVLVFKVNGANEEFLYHTSATDEHISNSSKTFKVLLQKSIGSVRHRIVVLANLRAEINAVKDSFTVGDPKADVLKLIEFSSTTAWKATSSSNFRLLPMWGESYDTHEITSTTTGITLGNIYLVRSLAKIDVLLDDNGAGVPQGLSGFKLSSVRLFKSREKGHAVPESVVRTVDAGTGNVNIKVTTPTIPSVNNGYNARLDYDKATVTDRAFLGEIYVLENNNKTEGDDAKRTCVVVGGYYTPDLAPENTTDVTWYRIDFYDRAGSPGDRLDVLRNHRYRVNITSVGGPGYETPEIAFESTPVNLDSEVIAWDEGGMNNHTSDGQYDLTTDKNEITLYEEGNIHLQQLTVFTNHPGGWTVEIPSVAPEDYSWISVSPDKLISSTSTETNVSATPYLNQLTERKGYFWLKAGKLKKKIHVTQLNVPELTLEVTPTQLLFRKSGSLAKVINVKTYPIGVIRYFQYGGAPISWDIYPGADDAFGELTYQFKPKVNNTGKILDASVTIEIRDSATGARTFKTVSIRQLASDLLFEITGKDALYPGAGGAKKFKVHSPEAPWQLITDRTLLDPLGMLSGHDEIEQGATTAPIDYNFMLAANPTFSPRIANFFATSSDVDFPRQKIEIVQGVVNPYINVITPIANAQSLHIHDAGATTGVAASITFDTNTSWSWSGDTNFGDVCDATNTGGFTAGTEYPGGTDAITPDIITQGFMFQGTYKTGLAATVNGGSAIQSVVTYSTLDHSPAPATSKQVVMKRTVRPMIESPTMSPVNGASVVAAAFNSTVTLKANVGTVGFACLTAGNNNTNVLSVTTSTRNPSVGWGTGTATMVIPENESWTVDRYIYMKYHKAGYADYTQIGYITQRARNLTASTVTPVGNIPTAGGIYTMATTTTSSTPNFRIRASYGDGSAITETGYGVVGARGITVAANNSWNNNRIVTFEYAREPTSGWHKAAANSVRTQFGYDLSGTNNNIPTPIPGSGGDYRINTSTVAGATAPNFRVRVSADGVGDLWHSGSGGVGLRQAYISESSGAYNRYIRVHFERLGYEWVQVYEGWQDKSPYYFINNNDTHVWLDPTLYGPAVYAPALAHCESLGMRLMTYQDWQAGEFHGRIDLQLIVKGVPPDGNGDRILWTSSYHNVVNRWVVGLKSDNSVYSNPANMENFSYYFRCVKDNAW